MMGGQKATRPILRLVSDAENKEVKVEKEGVNPSLGAQKKANPLSSAHYPSIQSEKHYRGAQEISSESLIPEPFTPVTPKSCDASPQSLTGKEKQNNPDFTPHPIESLYQSQIGKATQQAMDILATGILGRSPKASADMTHALALLYQTETKNKIGPKKGPEGVEDQEVKAQLPIKEVSVVKSVDASIGGLSDVSAELPAHSQELPKPFWQIWSGHHDYLLKQCLRMMAGNRFDAEDALSSAMVRASQKFDRFADQIVNERAWLSRLVHNVCIDHFRVDKKTDTRDFQDQQHHDLSHAMFCEPSLTPEEQALSREQLALLQEEVRSMSENLRRPLIMRFVDGMSYGEIAENLGLKADTVRKRIQLARDQLKASGIR